MSVVTLDPKRPGNTIRVEELGVTIELLPHSTDRAIKVKVEKIAVPKPQTRVTKQLTRLRTRD